MTELISFGEKGVDDLPISPEALERLNVGGRFVMLLEGEDEALPNRSWPVVPGDQIVFASFEDEEEPVAIAIVSPELANNPVVLGEVAAEDGEEGEGRYPARIVFGPGSPMTQMGRERRGVTLWDTAFVLCRVIALYVPLKLLGNLQGGVAAAFIVGTRGPERLITGASFILFLAVGVFLWRKAPQVADAMVPRKRRNLKVGPGAPVDLQALVFSTVGVLIVAESLPGIITLLTQIVIRPLEASEFGGIDPVGSFFVPQLVGGIARLVIGAWLILGSRRIAEWVASKRPSYTDAESKLDE